MNHFKNTSFHSSTSSSLRVFLLHGNLDIYVKQANNLPNMDLFHRRLGDVFGSIGIGSGNMSKITSDPYVTISISHSVIARTYVVENSENPVWDQHFNVPIAHRDTEVQFVVKDDDVVGSQVIGAVGIPTEQILSGSRIEGVYPILNSSGKQCKPGASLSLSIQYIPIERFYGGGVGAASGVPDTYFPLRPGGKVTLYQDAHVHESLLPKFKLDYGIDYVHGQCWNDIYDSISQARRLVYLTGWSVCHDVKLVREDKGRNLTLGELLKRKSQEGVRVLLLVWDDPTSRSLLGIKKIFRSIDSNSVKGFPKDPKDDSAYVKAIRSAQHFIYIENQYFLGSSYNWEKYNDLGVNNLIPMEIALKIANKIRGNQRFAVYIVIPMHPEGGSTANATQRILYWQNKTMQMMYDVIYKALQEVGLDNQYEPQDYLNFFCLGNRETQEVGHASDIGKNVPKNSPQFLARKNRRFMIYVHSKGMIVDDEYVILGSANINQRSMEGSRDTEIAMGAYQPQFTWEKKGSKPFGQIYGYRMSLWAEHTGVVEDCFVQPENIECVRRVRAMGEHNWRLYAGDELTEMTGHLLKYPVQVDRNGKVKSIPGCETFPDVGGNILGTYFIPIQENLTL